MKRVTFLAASVCAVLMLGTAVAANTKATVPAKPTPALTAPKAVSSGVMGLCHGGGGLIAVGAHGDILMGKTANHWKQVPSPVDILLTRCSFADSSDGWAVGHNEAILHTADGGQHWQVQHYDAHHGKPLMAVVAIDARHAVAVGAFDLLLRTVDGGKTWQAAPSDTFGELGPHLNDVIRLTGGNLLVVGEEGLVATSSDDGATWTKLTPPDAVTLFGAIPWGASGVLVYGIGGHAYVADDVAHPQWTTVQKGGGASLFGGMQVSARQAVLVGIHGTAVRVSSDLGVASITVEQMHRVVPAGVSIGNTEMTSGSVGSFAAVVVDGGTLVIGGEDGLVTTAASNTHDGTRRSGN